MRCLPLRPTTATSPRALRHSEHQTHLPLPPPAVVLALVAGCVLDLAREQRAALAKLLQDVAAERGARLQPGDDPPVDRAIAAAHERLEDRQVLDRIEEGVPLDELPLLPEQAVELGACRTARAGSRERDAAAARPPRSGRAGGSRAGARSRALRVAPPSRPCARTAMRRASSTGTSRMAHLLEPEHAREPRRARARAWRRRSRAPAARGGSAARGARLPPGRP